MDNLETLVTTVGPANTDSRRIIWEPVNGDMGKFCRLNFFDWTGQEAPGGNHYHERNEEVFFVTQGEISKMVIENIDTKERHRWKHLGVGTVIHMPVRHAHALVLAPGSKMIALCSQPFDENDKDMPVYMLLDKKTGEEIPQAVAA
ncbi:MAG TPA: cupin domain-containing protein [Candidatus Paceibacterota bacterium]|nr:cupin domain-containing protein [Candidatus Paceibacterota bacterium]